LNASNEKRDSTFHTLFIGSNRRTLDADAVFLNGMCGFDGDLVIGRITVFQTQIVVLAIDIDVRKDQLDPRRRRSISERQSIEEQTNHFFDPCPDDSRHFVSIQFNDRIVDFDSLLWRS
jgi:hypothetical protein